MCACVFVQEVLAEHEETLFPCEGGQALARVAQRGVEFPSLEILEMQLDMDLGVPDHRLCRGSDQLTSKKSLATPGLLWDSVINSLL